MLVAHQADSCLVQFPLGSSGLCKVLVLPMVEGYRSKKRESWVRLGPALSVTLSQSHLNLYQGHTPGTKNLMLGLP